MIHDAAEWSVFARWFRSRAISRQRQAGPSVGASPTVVEGSGEVEPDGRGEFFEGGGGVLLSPSQWEKAGWGIALLFTLMT